MNSENVDRREFIKQTTAAGVTAAGVTAACTVGVSALVAGGTAQAQDGTKPKKIRVGVVGCGSVSTQYLPHLSKCPYVELVSTCDIIPERAQKAAAQYGIEHHYPHIDQMLAGVDFDLLVTLADMQEHEKLNRAGLLAGKHVWSEKPIANSLPKGQELLQIAKDKGIRLWGAPTVVNSPQFAFMAQTVASGKLGRIAAAHADYGHTGPDWSAFFYQKGGGSMPDLGVYNITSLTGLLGPAKSVVAMTSIVTPTRKIHGKGEIQVTEEDNAMILLDHGQGTISHIQSGFNFFNPHGHDGSKEQRHTISIVGSTGSMGLVGYDWEPKGVDLATEASPNFERHVTDAKGYVWQQGASIAAESLVTGKELLIRPEHALHVLEIITAARESQVSGRRIDLRSTFAWPVIS